MSLNLENHLRMKLANRQWLEACLRGKSDDFPYFIENRLGSIRFKLFKTHQSPVEPADSTSKKPRYVINIPFALKVGKSGQEQIQRLAALFEKEAFQGSRRKDQTAQRIAIVIGVNRHQSLDPELNREFQENISKIPQITQVACAVFGFLWEPRWSRTFPEAYPLQKAYLLLKALKPSVAHKVLKKRESGDRVRSLVPFGPIRERIKNSRYTRDFLDYFDASAPKAPVYLSVMDSDCQKLRGIFSRFDDQIKHNSVPSALTFGYRVEIPERPLIEKGVELDMAVRAAMNAVIPYSAYFPEPCSIFRVRKPNGKPISLRLLSFGQEGSLESRRLIQSGLAHEVLDDNCLFVNEEGITTGVPNRMLKETNSVRELTPKKIKQKKTLQALRGISQSHANPFKWADSVYAALSFSTSHVADARAPIAWIFSVYDPITRMYVKADRFSSKVFSEVIRDYKEKLTKDQQALLDESRQQLENLGMSETIVAQIVKAAKKSGEAIYRKLRAWSGPAD